MTQTSGQPLPEAALRALLDERYDRYARPAFLADDPISLPHQFAQLADREIIGFWVAMLAWGNRKSILASGAELIRLMDGAPHAFIRDHSERDRKRFLSFKHRTFNATDALYFLDFLQRHYRRHPSLEEAFARHLPPEAPHVGEALAGFHRDFCNHPNFPSRTKKHVATPDRKSSCKRLNMFLRWMVRNDGRGVDFGQWKRLAPAQLLCPLDVHVARSARALGLLTRKQNDWQAVLSLTESLRRFDSSDPVKYDFALFGMGVLEKNARP
ncbi:MAG: TIGR02757 family protein [Bacteroidetes bacterium]|nr:TIGR02757 family protein [Bacteroidota bacterium]